MTRARRAVLLLASCACTSGCVWFGWGTYPLASGNGVEPQGLSSAKITTADVAATIDVGLYQPRMVFAGIVVPIVPIGWLPGGAPERLTVAIKLDGGTDAGVVQPDSLRIQIGAREYHASSIQVSQTVRTEASWTSLEPPADQPARAKDLARITYEFGDLVSPREPFSLVVDGLPRIDFVPVRRWIGTFAENK